ncbi:MAG: integrase family protein [Clostridium sp.]|nr:integrase family protein [Clostridium sp.]
MQSNKTCPILELYLNYLTIIKGRSNNTILEYRIDLLYFFKFISEKRIDSSFSPIISTDIFLTTVLNLSLHLFTSSNALSSNSTEDTFPTVTPPACYYSHIS